MAENNYINLLNTLTSLKAKSRPISQGNKFHELRLAQDYIRGSQLPEDEKQVLISEMNKAANPSGWHYESNGIQVAIDILDDSLTMGVAA